VRGEGFQTRGFRGLFQNVKKRVNEKNGWGGGETSERPVAKDDTIGKDGKGLITRGSREKGVEQLRRTLGSLKDLERKSGWIRGKKIKLKKNS